MVVFGCTAQPDVGVVNDEDPLTSTNGISSNGISSNGITSNGITSNGITSNGISSNSLATNSVVMSALRDPSSTGDLSRIFFRYVVNCALPAGQTVTYNWTDSAGVLRTENNPGGLGLAPTWQTGPVEETGKEIVSACLAARTNSLGITVPISMRAKGVGSLAVSTAERSSYTYGEGSFWGNLFATPPVAYSCSKAPYLAGTETSQYTSKGRTCAAGDCGVVKYVGRCITSDHTTTGQACYDRDKAYDDWASDCYTALNKGTTAGSANVISTWLMP